MAPLTPFEKIGGEAVVRAVSAEFYNQMDAHFPALAKLHKLDDAGRVHPEARERFALFFIGWLGGPQTYMEQHGHPRLRMRHAHVPIDQSMRDDWVHAMQNALNAVGVSGEVRELLDNKLAEVASFLVNQQ